MRFPDLIVCVCVCVFADRKSPTAERGEANDYAIDLVIQYTFDCVRACAPQQGASAECTNPKLPAAKQIKAACY